MLDFNSLSSFQKVDFIFLNIQVLIAVVGITSNTIAICVFLRRRLRKYSYSFYCVGLAIAQSLILIHAFRHWSRVTFDANLDTVARFFCKIDEYLPYSHASLAACLFCVISADRYVTIVFPNRLQFFKKKWFQVLVVFVAIVYSLAVNILVPIHYELTESNFPNSSETIRECSMPIEIFNSQTWVYFINFIVINTVVNNILTIRLIYFVLASRKQISNSSANNSKSRDRKFAISSIVLNICNFVLELPFTVSIMVSSYLKIGGEYFQMIFSIVLAIVTLTNGTSFYVNYFTNSIFHDELLVMLGLQRRQEASTVGSSTNTTSLYRKQKSENN